MRQNVTPDRSARVRSCEGHAASRVSHDLVGELDGHTELIRNLQDAIQQVAQFLLAVCQLASSAEVHSEELHDAVDDQQGTRLFQHQCCHAGDEREQLVHILGSGLHHIRQGGFRV